MFTQPLLPSGRRVRFIHEFHGVYFRSGYDKLFLDRALYEPVSPVFEQDGVFFLSLEDLSRIYSPDLLIQAEGGRIRLRFQKYLDTMERVQIDRQWYLREVPAEEAVLTVGEPLAQAHGEFIELSMGPREIGGVLYLPAVEVMTKAFGARPVPTKNMTALTFYEDLTFPLVLWRYYSSVVRGRTCGEIHRSFWFEEGRRVIPYHMYIPTDYQPDAPNKAVFYSTAARLSVLSAPFCPVSSVWRIPASFTGRRPRKRERSNSSSPTSSPSSLFPPWECASLPAFCSR